MQEETLKRKSKFDPNRTCYLSSDGKYYVYEIWDEDSKRYVKKEYEVGKGDYSTEWTIMLDETDHEHDLNNDKQNGLKDPRFEQMKKTYAKDPNAEGATDPMEGLASSIDDPSEALDQEEQPENPDIAKVREVIDTKCNDRQQAIFFGHFGQGKQLEQIRKEEVEKEGKEKKLQAVLNVKNDVIKKVADELGVIPVKRRKTGGKD